MRLGQIQDWFAAHELPFEWRRDVGPNGEADAILSPINGQQTIPMAGLGAAIIVPDVHLGILNDIFRYSDPSHAPRLEKFLRALGALRDELKLANSDFAAIQLGDWYDLMRVPGTTASERRSLIDHTYPQITSVAASLPLLHCIGNHDKDFWNDPPPPDEASYAIVRQVGSADMVCFHGHDQVTLYNIVVHNLAATLGLSLLNVINSLPLLGYLTSWLQAQGDGTLADSSFNTTESKPWPPGVAGPPDWDAPWVSRDDAVDLGTVVRGLEKGLNHVVQVAFIGHSHQPGISWAWITQQRRVVLVDVGSWTYGRTEFGVVGSDGIGLARLV